MVYNISVLENISLKVRNEVEGDLRKIEKHHSLYFPHSTVRLFKSRHKIYTTYCNENNEL